jgi:hypothetical protein
MDSGVLIPIASKNGLIDIGRIPPKIIKSELASWKSGPMFFDAAKVHNLPGLSISQVDYNRIWANKIPSLRHARLKVLYKDIYSNERRFRFGIASSSACAICNDIETVEHQLFTCQNAKKIWGFFTRLTSTNISTFCNVLRIESSPAIEIVKCIALKRLIQIDRSSTVTEVGFYQECLYHLNVELIVRKNNSTSILEEYLKLVSRTKSFLNL